MHNVYPHKANKCTCIMEYFLTHCAYYNFLGLINCNMTIFRFIWMSRQTHNFKAFNSAYSTLRYIQPALTKGKENLLPILNPLENQRKRFFCCKNILNWSLSWFPIRLLNFGFNFSLINITKNIINNGSRKKKNVYMVTDHFKYHASVKRKKLLGSLKEKIEKIPGKRTKVVYIVGLPGTGKRELTRQYAQHCYASRAGRNESSNVFVAMIDASNPKNFHQDLLKISEKIGITDYSTKAEKENGYNKILCEITSHIEEKKNWLLVLNDIKLDDNLKWLIGERYFKQENEKYTFDLSHLLPSSGDPSNGTILVTTCDTLAYRHHAPNTTWFNMPGEMEEDEALELLQIGSSIPNLHNCESAKNVISALGFAPIPVYW